jgi:hypothetical protein
MNLFSRKFSRKHLAAAKCYMNDGPFGTGALAAHCFFHERGKFLILFICCFIAKGTNCLLISTL